MNQVRLTYLTGVHLEFADDLDGHFARLACAVLGAVDITEGTVAHLLQQDPALQAWVLGEFALALPFLGDDAFNNAWVQVFGPLLELLLVAGGLGSGSSSLSGDVSVVDVGGGEVGWLCGGMLQRFVGGNVGITEAVMILGRRRGLIALLMSVHGGDVGGGIAMSIPSLLSMADEVFQILDGRHG